MVVASSITMIGNFKSVFISVSVFSLKSKHFMEEKVLVEWG
jgi:hypothetical protein